MEAREALAAYQQSVARNATIRTFLELAGDFCPPGACQQRSAVPGCGGLVPQVTPRASGGCLAACVRQPRIRWVGNQDWRMQTLLPGPRRCGLNLCRSPRCLLSPRAGRCFHLKPAGQTSRTGSRRGPFNLRHGKQRRYRAVWIDGHAVIDEGVLISGRMMADELRKGQEGGEGHSGVPCSQGAHAARTLGGRGCSTDLPVP